MNFYLSAVDDLLRHPDDKPSIGLILCKEKDGIVAEYALRDMTKPLSVAEFTHFEKLPEERFGPLINVLGRFRDFGGPTCAEDLIRKNPRAG